MARTRINWIEAKARYIRGNIEDISEFMSVVYQWHNRSGNFQVRTKGWKEERQDYQTRLEERRNEALMNNPLIDENAEKALLFENKLMSLAIKGLDEFESLVEFDQGGTPIITRNVTALRSLWEMARIAQNKHINGTKNENINKNLNFSLKDLVDEITTKK
jgi:hypothetical protein